MFGQTAWALPQPRSPASEARVAYLLSFNYGAANDLRWFRPLVHGGATLWLRTTAFTHLADVAQGLYGDAGITEAERPQWTELFRSSVADSRSFNSIYAAVAAEVALGDLAVVPLLGARLAAGSLNPGLHQYAVCSAYKLTRENPSTWSAFAEQAEAAPGLHRAALAALADPTSCDASAALRRAGHERSSGNSLTGPARSPVDHRKPVGPGSSERVGKRTAGELRAR